MAANPGADGRVESDAVPRLLSGVGVLLFVGFLVEWALLRGVTPETVVSTTFLVSCVITALFSGGVVYGGLRLEHGDLPPERHPRILGWVGGGAVVYFLINVPMILVWTPPSEPYLFGWVRYTLGLGSAVGLLVGFTEAHAIQRACLAERAAARAEAAEDHHRHLDYLNSLLRHEVLNTANVITGYASLLLDADDVDDTARERLETIHRQGRDMTRVIRDVQVLLRTARGDTALEPRNLSATLAAELDDLRRTYESVETEAAIPDDVYVRADDLLPRLFSNLLVNAVEHNDGETARVEVTLEESAGTATVYVEDDGPGVPADERVCLFERGDNTGGTHGLGLYLVGTLADRYDGRVELVETGPDGSTFAVELPTCAPDSQT